jgi:hypothetical protein
MSNPDVLYRQSDGEKFIKNANGSYSMRASLAVQGDHYCHEWSYGRLMDTKVFSEHPPTNNPKEKQFVCPGCCYCMGGIE